MSNTTRDLLAEIAAKYPKKMLLTMWADLRKLSKHEFEMLLAECAERQPTPPRRRNTRRAMENADHSIPDDTPVSRIEHMLLKQQAMSQARAVEEIATELKHQGIAASRIPSFKGGKLADWLVALFRSVSASLVMHAALTISARAPRDANR
jgi:hypothetical protein